MAKGNGRWVTVSDSPHEHEREAMAWLRSRLPDREPFHVWTNFEFLTRNGKLYEVDALAITDNGVHLIEFKAHPGTFEGDASTWQHTWPEGRTVAMDNPRPLANRKAKALKSVLENTRTFNRNRRDVPYIAECVFLSDPDLTSKLSPQGRDQIFGRDAEVGKELPPERANLGGIVDYLTSLKPDESGRRRKRIDRTVVDRLVKAVDQAGIRELSSRREVGDYYLGQLLDDVDTDSVDSIVYQDFVGKHKHLETLRRLRVYPLEHNSNKAKRETAERAAKREHELINALDHPGILRPIDYTVHERGPVLIFDYDQAEVTLTQFMSHPQAKNAPIPARINMVRQMVEALAYAHGRGIFHRGLSPDSVLVRPPLREPGQDGPLIPRIRIANWQAGAKYKINPEETRAAMATGTSFGAVTNLAPGEAELYRAPEFLLENARPTQIDVFGLGALMYFVLTGTPPAQNSAGLRKRLIQPGYLDPSDEQDGLDAGLVEAVIEATFADTSERYASTEDFLARLDLVEEAWRTTDETAEASPINALRGDTLGDGRFQVVKRLGQGGTAVALLAKDAADSNNYVVLKVAQDIENNDRIIDEAAALDGLQHTSIVRLLDGPLELSGHMTIVLSFAGIRPRPGDEERPSQTLAQRLESGPVGVELTERWGTDILDALRYLERMGRSHRDIKPDNLGVTEQGAESQRHLMLFDFSLAGAGLEQLEAGTPGYIDPFLARRGHWDPAADRYSATVTLFELAAGTKPRYGDGTTDPGLVPQDPTIDASMFDNSVGEALASFFQRALQPEVSDRFDTAEEMYYAWHEAFKGASQPTTPTMHPDDEFVVPADTTLDSPLASLPMSRRSVDALATIEVFTVNDLLNTAPNRIKRIPGIGRSTRGDIFDSFYALKEAVGEPTAGKPDESTKPKRRASDRDEPQPSTPQPERDAQEPDAEDGSGSEIRALLEGLLPEQTTANQETRFKLMRVLLGLDSAIDPWATHADIATHIGISRGRISQLLGPIAEEWTEDKRLAEQVSELASHVAVHGIQTLDNLVVGLVGEQHRSNATATRHARGLLRAASIVEERKPSNDASLAMMVLNRETVLFATTRGKGHQGDDVANALFTYVKQVADSVSKLVLRRDVVSRSELLEAIYLIDRPEIASPLADAHLAEIAAILCPEAAVNRRLELYRSGLEPAASLRAARRAFIAGNVTPKQIIDKLASRFPEAEPIPDRPQLDALLTEAGHDLVWNQEEGRYESEEAKRAASASATFTRVPTHTTRAPEEVDEIAEAQARLERGLNTGGILTLVAPDQKKLPEAAIALGTVADQVVDVDAWLIEELHRLTEPGKPSWKMLCDADALGLDGKRWPQVNLIVSEALEKVTERIFATEGTVLVANLGLLPRYDSDLEIIGHWRDRLHENRNSDQLQSLWLLVASTPGAASPMIDRRPMGLIDHEWTPIDGNWLADTKKRLDAETTAAGTPTEATK